MKHSLAALAALLAATPLAPRAQAPRPPAERAATPDPTAQAKTRFRKGTELYKQARYREAIAEFEAAYKLRPHGIIFFNLAQCHERIGDIPAALQAYHEYLRAVPDAEDVNTVRAAMSNLESRLGASGVQQLLVYTDPSGAEVLVDGLSKGRSPLAMVLPHGNHSVTLLKPGYKSSTRQAVLSPQASVEIDVSLQKLDVPGSVALPPPPPVISVAPTSTPLPGTATGKPAPPTAVSPPPPAPKAGPRSRIWTWVAAGASVAALGAGAYYGMEARKAQSELRDGTMRSQAAAQKLADDAKSRSRNANILFGVGAAAGAGAGALFFYEVRF